MAGCSAPNSFASEALIADGGGAKPASAAHGFETIAEVAALELVQEAVHENRARRAERMANGDSPAVDIRLVHVGAGLLLPRENHRSESLVDLEEVDAAQLEAGALQHRRGAWDRPFEHQHRVGAYDSLGANACARPQSELLRFVQRHE